MPNSSSWIVGLTVGCALAAAAPTSERTLVIPAAPEATLDITCVAGKSSRIILPEALRRLKGLGAAREALGLTVEQSSPVAILAVHPPTHPARGSIEFQGPTLLLHLDITTSDDPAQAAGDLRVILDDPVAPPPAPGPEPSPPTRDHPKGEPADEPARPGAPSVPALDLPALLAAKPVRIDRREGLPGQPELRLQDSLEAEKWVFYRFRLEDGVEAGMRKVRWEGADVRTYALAPAGNDLMIVVQLPRAEVDHRTRLELETGSGVVYRCVLLPPTLPARIRGLFQ